MAKTRRPPAPPPPPPPPPAPAETPSPQRKRKKKGRPSLLDLQRRSLRLQAQSPEAASPPPPPSRRGPDPSDDDDDAGGAGTGRRRQKRLKNVLSGAGEEEGEGAAAVEEKKDAAKATGKGAAASSGGGPTGTPLPDKKLLLFILDRLQKKDTYGVYSDPVDPEELPDYHELIEHPMDFSTIREKLLSDKYTILEQFENDVFLLTSNAMSYNSEDTVYYRQARSIEALAKKDFENLRQASDSEEEQPKTAPRRGRPPKNAKKTVEKVEDDGSPDLSNVKGNRSVDNTETRKRWTSDRARNNITMRNSSILHNTFGSFSGKKTEKTGLYSGSSKYGKKTTILDDDRRSTYDQQYSNYSPLFSALDCERKQLLPIGLQQQHAYARSLARFAAKLGPIGWDIAAKGIRRVLPPGTKFGPGWVIDGEPPQNSQCPRVPEVTDPSTKSSIPSCGIPPKSDDVRRSSELSSNVDAVVGEEHVTKNQPVASTSAGFDRSSTSASKVPTYENGVTMSCDGVGNTRPTTPPLQQQSNSQEVPSNINGIIAAPNTMGQYGGQGLFGPGMQMTHAQVLGMFSGVNGRANGFLHGHRLTEDSVKTAQNGVLGKTATTSPLQDADHDPNQKGSFPQEENRSASPSLNSASSPPRGKAAANLKQPDLVLQL